MKQVYIDIKPPDRMSAADYYRGFLPYRHLQKDMADAGVQLSIGAGLDPKKEYDGILAHCYYLPEAVVHLLNRQLDGTKLGYDNDDLLLDLPDWHPIVTGGGLKRETMESIRVLFSRANIVMMSTERLKLWWFGGGNLSDTGAECFVCPNLIDLDDWGGGMAHPEDKEKIRILWVGTNTHQRDLEMLTPAITYIAMKYRHKVEIICMGQVPVEWRAIAFPTVREIPQVPLDQYFGRLKAIQPHIAICPLVENKFAACKSNCKWMETTMAGAATIMSTWTGKEYSPYQVALMDGAGMRVENTSAAWVDGLSFLINEHERRWKLHAENMEFLRREWSWQSPSGRGKEQWKKALMALGDEK